MSVEIAAGRPHPSVLTTSGLRGVAGQPTSEILDRDDLATKDNSLAPNVSVVQRFHCIYM